jgi:hypothetical protein
MPGRFIPGENVPGTLFIGRWVSLRADLDGVEKRKFFTLPGLSIVQPVASCYADCAIQAIPEDRTFLKESLWMGFQVHRYVISFSTKET